MRANSQTPTEREKPKASRIRHRSKAKAKDQLKLSRAGNSTVHEECPPSSSSLRESVSKVCINKTRKRSLKKWVPVVDLNQKPLMSTSGKKARKLIEKGEATPFWNHGVFCIRLNREPSARNIQLIAVGIDPGSKKEGFSIKSAAHTFLNVQADAVTWVKGHVETRRNLRTQRRGRKTPCRQNRKNRSRGSFPPSTKARWQWKLRVLDWLRKMFPVALFVVEDVKAWTKKGQRKWNENFSPIERGKTWFYDELRKRGVVILRAGWETKALRDKLGLKKSSNKGAEVFSAHGMDAWVLANEATGGHEKPDNERLLCVVPLQFHRRKLHFLVPHKGGRRPSYGGTRSLGFKRGSLVKHPKYGVVYVGGTLNGLLSLHSLSTGARLTQRAKSGDCKFLAFNSFRSRSIRFKVKRIRRQHGLQS
jgi:hypothetical protein